MKILATFLLVSFPILSRSQGYTGANDCYLRILTDHKLYEFRSRALEARLNGSLNRFEFMIPIDSIFAVKDSTDLDFLYAMADVKDYLIINASIPDSGIDLSYFKGNATVNLSGEIIIGDYYFKDDASLKGMVVEESNILNFDLQVFLRRSTNALARIGDENIIEVEVSARGNRISHLG
ncbi:MAG TPA: hypothetical protein VFW11_21915 [Cyclobacteriaceae bacterium]|nr:hypothetical protein [Cyclobacteriaceae bacterium]